MEFLTNVGSAMGREISVHAIKRSIVRTREKAKQDGDHLTQNYSAKRRENDLAGLVQRLTLGKLLLSLSELVPWCAPLPAKTVGNKRNLRDTIRTIKNLSTFSGSVTSATRRGIVKSRVWCISFRRI